MKKLILIITILSTVSLFAQKGETVLKEKFNIKRIYIDESDAMMSHILDGTIDKEGNIYLIDYVGIYKFDKDGKHIKSLYAKGKGPGEFESLQKIDIDNNRNELILIDNRIHKIVKYNTDLEFISEFRMKYISSVSSACFLNDSLYVTYLAHALNTPIKVYNINSEKLIKSLGISSELFKKYKIRRIGGGAIIYKGNIYYMCPSEYKIMKTNLENKTENILKEVPSHFRETDRKLNRNERIDYPFSYIDRIFNLDGKFYVTSFTPRVNGKIKVLCDIISDDGKILEEKLDGRIMVQCKQLDATHLIRVSDARDAYPEDDKRSAIIVRIMELKDGK